MMPIFVSTFAAVKSLSRPSLSGMLAVGLLAGSAGARAESLSSPENYGGARGAQLRIDRIRGDISPNEPWLGLVGDSGISGAASAENIHATLSSIVSKFVGFLMDSRQTFQIADIGRIPDAKRFGLEGTFIDPLVRVMYSQVELEEARREGQEMNLRRGSKASLLVDIPEYSYGYLVGRALGFPAQRIVLTAQDGQRVDSIYKQMQRFGEIAPTLPSHILISYTANDLCGDELDGSLEDFSANFRKVIERELNLSLQNLKPHPVLGTKVIVMAPLDVPQILTNRALFAQKITFAGAPREIFGRKFYLTGAGAGQVTCGDVRYGTAGQSWIGQQMQNTLKGMCRSVFSTSPDDTARVQKLTDFQNEQIRVWKEVLAGLQKPGWSFEINEATRQPRFERGDLANDCFHPGPGAHAKLAEEVIQSLGPHFTNSPAQP